MTRFIYIYDTYCGWCYGASPVIEALVASDLDVAVMHRHLFQGDNAHRMGDGFGQMAERYDQRISQLTGQRFGADYTRNILRAPDEILESGLTAQAAALVHDRGADVEIALAKRLQKARFVDGVSAQDSDAVQQILTEFGETTPLSEGAAKAADISAEAATLQAQLGIRGVPALLRYQNGSVTQIDLGAYYTAPETIAALAA